MTRHEPGGGPGTGLEYDVEHRLARRSPGGLWWLALLAIPLLLAGLLSVIKVADIEDDLTKRSQDALAAAGFDGVGVEFDGRDGTLTVPEGVDAAAAVKAVEDVEGVRIANAEDAKTEEPAPTTPTATKPAATTPGAVPDTCDELGGSTRIQFTEGSATLTEAGLAEVKKYAGLLKTCEAAEVLVAGHTDNQGSQSTSLPLSQKRADAVKAALVADGVAADRITATGYGDTQPIGDNDTEAGRAQNRRIEITIQGA